MKFYTKLGDDGSTSLYGGHRVMKDDIRIEVSGDIDELNAHIGLLSAMVEGDVSEILDEIQARLFIVGASMSSMADGSWRVGKEVKGESSLSDLELARLEQEIDRLQAAVPQLETFVLPGGSAKAAQSHVCRTVCRRVERRLVALSRDVDVDALTMRFVNRLSDYFFSLALYLNFIEGYDEKNSILLANNTKITIFAVETRGIWLLRQKPNEKWLRYNR